jgi:prevent-host-death family protein
MKTASVANVKANFGAFVKQSAHGPVVVTRGGKAVAAIVSLTEDDDVEHLLLSYSPKFRALLAASGRQIRSGQKLGHDQFWREVDAAAIQAAGGQKKAHL